MNPIRSFWFAFACMMLSACAEHSGHFTLVNQSDEPIKIAVVKISGQEFDIRDLSPTSSFEGMYKINSDDSYKIYIEFMSGNKLSTDTGYVTNGMDFQHTIIVTNSEISVVGGKSN